MQDQMARLPLGLRGEAFYSGQPAQEQQRVVEVGRPWPWAVDLVVRCADVDGWCGQGIKDSSVRLLFVSPERLFTRSFQRLLKSGLLPPVSLVRALACCDAADCWLLVLALTATLPLRRCASTRPTAYRCGRTTSAQRTCG